MEPYFGTVPTRNRWPIVYARKFKEMRRRDFIVILRFLSFSRRATMTRLAGANKGSRDSLSLHFIDRQQGEPFQLPANQLKQQTMSLRSVLKLLAAGSTGLAGAGTARDDADSQSIQWGNCDFGASASIQCGSLDVPRDYTDDSAGTLELPLAKVTAVNEPSMGTILVNFGGPGNDATEMLGGFAELLLK